MSKRFNLLLLHQPSDIHPRSWICLQGTGLKVFVNRLEKDVLESHGYCRESLSRALSIHFHCSCGVIKRILQGKGEFYPIPLILKLSKLSRNGRKILKNIKENIECLKVNSASAKPIKGVYQLSENLAKILGAFMADGSLSIQIVFADPNLRNLEEIKRILKRLKIRYSTGNTPARNQYYVSIQASKNNYELLNKVLSSHHYLTQTHYSIELSDEYKDNVEAFTKWIKDEFDINPNQFEKRENAWRVSFSNKILARYLMIFFGVKPGLKTYSAFEPEIIAKSNLKTRKSFAKGVLMFDGCVTFDKKILFTVKSGNLTNSIVEIWKKDKIKFGKWKNRRDEWHLYTTSENKKEGLLEYFEKNTQKWKLLKWLGGDSNYTPATSTIRKNSSFLSLERILNILQKVKCCDANFLKNHFKCDHHSTIRTYLKILREQQKIKLSDRPKCISKYVDRKATVLLKNKFHNFLFLKIRDKFETDKNFAKFLGIHKATMSSWRVRKNRIPLYILKEMCKVLELDFGEAAINIAKTDREIAEII